MLLQYQFAKYYRNMVYISNQYFGAEILLFIAISTAEGFTSSSYVAALNNIISWKISKSLKDLEIWAIYIVEIKGTNIKFCTIKFAGLPRFMIKSR